MTVKGVGTLVYVDVDSDDEYVEVDCVITSKLPGFARGIIEDDACLADAEVTQDSGDLKLTPFTGTMLFDVNATVDNALEAAITADTEIKMGVKIPKATPVYVYMVGKLTALEPGGIVRDKKLSRDFEFLPTATPTKSTTAPTLEA